MNSVSAATSETSGLVETNAMLHFKVRLQVEQERTKVQTQKDELEMVRVVMIHAHVFSFTN